MIRPIAKEIMVDVKLVASPKSIYKVRNIANLATPGDMNMTINTCQKPLINTTAVEAKNLKENVAIILQSLKNKCVINVNPAEQDLSIVQEQMENVLKNLRDRMKNSYDRIVGIVVGGRAYDTSNKYADKGVQFTDAICEFLEKEHLPSTKLIEQKFGRHTKGIDLYSHRGNVVLSGGVINDFERVKQAPKEDIQKTGEELFEIFEVSDYAPIKIVNEILPACGTNTKFLR